VSVNRVKVAQVVDTAVVEVAAVTVVVVVVLMRAVVDTVEMVADVNYAPKIA
jgi:hypothetical protein